MCVVIKVIDMYKGVRNLICLSLVLMSELRAIPAIIICPFMTVRLSLPRGLLGPHLVL